MQAALVLLAILACLAAGPARADEVGDTVALGQDYQPGHKGWNGLSELAALAADLRCPIEPRATLEWDTLGGGDVLLVLYPESPLDEGNLIAFLSAGGRVVLADDFGAGAGDLRRLGIERHPGPLPASVPTYREGPALPIAVPVRSTALGNASAEVVTNHPAYFTSSLPATYAFAPSLGLVIEGTLGRGRFVALSDPSLFINNMLELPQDRALAIGLLAVLCRPGEDRFLLLTGPLSQRGSPPAALPGAPQGDGPADLPDRWNRALAGANLHIQEGLARSATGLDAAALAGLVLTIAALLLQLRYLPLSAAPHDASFAQAPRPPGDTGGLYGAVSRYARPDVPVPWGYQFPAALLREEVLVRLSPYLTRLPRYGAEAARVSPAQIEAAVSGPAGARAGKLAAALWREFRTIPGRGALGGGEGEGLHVSTAWVPERRMNRLYRLAMALFAELDSQPEHRT